LSFTARPSQKHRDVSDEQVRQLFAQELYPALSGIRERLARIAVGDWQPDRDLSLRRRAGLVGIFALLGAAGVIGFVAEIGLERHQIVREMIPHLALWAVAATAGMFLLALFIWLGRTPHTHATVFDILLVALPGVWFAASGALTWYNEHYDVSPARRFAVRVESIYTTKHRSSTTYHLVVESWPDQRGQRDVVVPQHEIAQLGDRCVFAIWHPGRLGDSWVSGFERAGVSDCAGGRIE
jgi:hypothetical protein